MRRRDVVSLPSLSSPSPFFHEPQSLRRINMMDPSLMKRGGLKIEGRAVVAVVTDASRGSSSSRPFSPSPLGKVKSLATRKLTQACCSHQLRTNLFQLLSLSRGKGRETKSTHEVLGRPFFPSKPLWILTSFHHGLYLCNFYALSPLSLPFRALVVSILWPDASKTSAQQRKSRRVCGYLR